MRFVHIADVHLGRRVDEDLPWGKNASQEIYDNFSAFVDYVEVNPVDFIFITGDLFDHVPSREEIRWVDMELSRLNGVDIIYVTGECDYLARGSALWNYKFISPVYLLNGEEFKNSVIDEQRPKRTKYADSVVDCVYFPKFNLDIYGICQYNSTNTRTDIEFAYAHDLDRKSILLAHGGADNVGPFDMDAMKVKRFSYIGLGHFHHSRIEKEYKVYYPGSLSPLSYEETGEHGFIKGYMDEFICDVKFIPFSDRLYKTLEFKVDDSITNSELLKKIDDICCKNKRYIYTINIERETSCYTDFDLSKLYDRYRIFKISGEKSQIEDIIKLGELNADNILGQSIHKLSKLEMSNSTEILVDYTKRILPKLFSDYDNVIPMQKVDSARVLEVHKEVEQELNLDLDMVKQGLSLCEVEEEKLIHNLTKNPDMIGDINMTREQMGKVEFELTQIEFKDAQVDKIYDRNRLWFILLLDTPIVLFWIYCTTLDFIATYFKRTWGTWYNTWITTLILAIAVAIGAYVLYNNTKKLRKGIFGTPIPVEEHVKYKNMMDVLEEDKIAFQYKLKELEEKQNVHKRLIKVYKELQTRKEKLGSEYNIIKSILREIF